MSRGIVTSHARRRLPGTVCTLLYTVNKGRPSGLPTRTKNFTRGCSGTYATKFNLAPENTLAAGDGANDIAMIQAAGLGVAYHAKPKVAQAAAARIDHGDLTALLYAQGYRRDEFVSDGG